MKQWADEHAKCSVEVKKLQHGENCLYVCHYCFLNVLQTTSFWLWRHGLSPRRERFMKKICLHFHKWRRVQSSMCCCMSTAVFLQVFHAAQKPPDSLTGQGCMEVPLLWATDLYEERMFVSEHVYICVSVWWMHDTAWFDWFAVWPGLSFSMKNRRWHTRAAAARRACVCVNKRVRSHFTKTNPNVRPLNCQRHFTAAYMHILGNRTTNSILTRCPLQAWEAIFNPASLF